MESKGVIFFMVNGKIKDTNKFLFNLEKQSEEELWDAFEDTFDSFIKWYSTFKNREDLHKFSIYTNNYRCENACVFRADLKFSVLDILFSRKKLLEVINRICQDYGVACDLEEENIE